MIFQVEMVRYFFCLLVIILTLFWAPLMTLIVLNNIIFIVVIKRTNLASRDDWCLNASPTLLFFFLYFLKSGLIHLVPSFQHWVKPWCENRGGRNYTAKNEDPESGDEANIYTGMIVGEKLRDSTPERVVMAPVASSRGAQTKQRAPDEETHTHTQSGTARGGPQ